MWEGASHKALEIKSPQNFLLILKISRNHAAYTDLNLDK